VCLSILIVSSHEEKGEEFWPRSAVGESLRLLASVFDVYGVLVLPLFPSVRNIAIAIAIHKVL
jgi:hypothetical protein